MRSDVILYQKLTHRAWVAKNTINHKGWLVRLSEGITDRVNSVLPIEYTGSNVGEDIKLVEDMYKQNKLPAIFQIPDYYEPSNLPEYLQEIGYKRTDETKVMTKEVQQEDLNEENETFDFSLVVDVPEEWFLTLQRINNYNEFVINAFREIISRTPNIKVTCSVKNKDIIVGIVLGVIEKSFMGIYDLLIDSNFRRKGIGEFITRKILSYAYESNLKTVYLQVEAKNLPAVNLYEKLGFEENFRYRYMKKEIGLNDLC
jgi:ribosomal protein S18 acetylase RimI-like enzyme